MSINHWPIDQMVEFFKPIGQATGFTVYKTVHAGLNFEAPGSTSLIQACIDNASLDVTQNLFQITVQLSLKDCLENAEKFQTFFRCASAHCPVSAIKAVKLIGEQFAEIAELCGVIPTFVQELVQAGLLSSDKFDLDCSFANFESFSSAGALLNVSVELVVQLQTKPALNQKVFVFKSARVNDYSIHKSSPYTISSAAGAKRFVKSFTSKNLKESVAAFINDLSP